MAHVGLICHMRSVLWLLETEMWYFAVKLVRLIGPTNQTYLPAAYYLDATDSLNSTLQFVGLTFMTIRAIRVETKVDLAGIYIRDSVFTQGHFNDLMVKFVNLSAHEVVIE